MPLLLRSLTSSKVVPISYEQPESDVDFEGRDNPHVVKMFPAIIREVERSAETIDPLSDSGATCYYHEHRPATAICELSGRMICDLCKTTWEGQVVSIQALHEHLAKNKQVEKAPFRWDRFLLYWLFFPIVFVFTIPLTVITAPLGALISLFLMIKPPQASIVPVSRGRYGFYFVLSLAMCAVCVYFILKIRV